MVGQLIHSRLARTTDGAKEDAAFELKAMLASTKWIGC